MNSLSLSLMSRSKASHRAEQVCGQRELLSAEENYGEAGDPSFHNPYVVLGKSPVLSILTTSTQIYALLS